MEYYDAWGLDALIAIGGDGTMSISKSLSDLGMNVVGVPKTIDNDLEATDLTFGHDSAVYVITEAIDRLRTTASSHHRVMVIETMGRYAGWLALNGGLAGGAEALAKRGQAVADEDIRVACHLVELAVQAEPENKGAHGARGEIYQRRREQETSLMAKGIFGFAARDSQNKAGERE